MSHTEHTHIFSKMSSSLGSVVRHVKTSKISISFPHLGQITFLPPRLIYKGSLPIVYEH